MVTKTQARRIFKAFFKDSPRGLKEKELLIKENDDGSTVLFEVSEYKGTLGYGFLVLDPEGNITYDQGDGELTMHRIMEVYRNINTILHYPRHENMQWGITEENGETTITLIDTETNETYENFGEYYEKTGGTW